jgi:phytoene dehydrogenase-like protein
MTHDAYDVAIIGGGHNGLTCAAYLAGAGLRVVVLEKNAVVGGAAVTEEFHPGFRNSVAAYTVSLLSPVVIADLELERHGLRILERPVANFWPVDERRSLLMPYGRFEARAVARSRKDAERLPVTTPRWRAAEGAIWRCGRHVGGLLASSAQAWRAGWQNCARGERLLLDLLPRARRTSGWWFESDVVKGALPSTSAPTRSHHAGNSVSAAALAFGEVNGRPGVWGHAVGGMGAISEGIAQAARARGAVIRTGAEVAGLVVKGGRACGVELATGERIAARAVAANVAPKLLFRDLVPEGAIDPELRRRFTGLKSGSGVFRMNVALTELPDFTCRPGKPQDHYACTS